MTAAMRPETLKELFWNGFSYISERILQHNTPTDDPEARYVAADRAHHHAITVDRIKPPSSATNSAPNPLPFSQDYELIWRDGPHDHISPAGFEAIASLLRAWKDDLVAGHVVRCPYPRPVVRRFDDENRHETRLSAVVHNFMFQRSGENSEQAWKDASVEFLKAIEATERWISVLYAPGNFETMKSQGIVLYNEISTSVQQFWDSRCGICAVGDFLAFAILESHQWGHPGMQFSQLSLMKLLVDLEAFHRQQPILSFVSVERQNHPPGYLFDDDDGAVESVTAEELRNLWLGSRAETSVSLVKWRNPSVCHIYGNGTSSARSQEALRRSRIVSAAAASLKSSRRLANGSGPLLISPTRSLLSQRYKAGAHGQPCRTKFYALPFIKDYQMPAKRKAKTATPDPRQFKRSRLETTAHTEFGNTKAAADAAAFAAACVPLPPSPATTEVASDDEADVENAAAGVEFADQRRLPWASIFPEDDDDATFMPRLRISTSKADELRNIAKERYATQEAARLKREAEMRRKEEEEIAKRSGLRPPARKVISSLSDSWHSRVNSAVCADPNKDIAKSPEGTILRRNDFKTVVSKSEWLNDEIVNGSLLHLANYINGKVGITNPKTQTPKCHAFTSFFWKPLSTKGAAGTERWMKRVGVTKDNFLKIDTILIPICEHNHWTLVVVRPGRTTITHMDSLRNKGAGRREVTDTVMRWVRELLKDKFSDKWHVQHYDSPRQTNGWDCGVHTITNALFLSLGLDPSFYKAVEMPLQRDRIAATLINGGFSGDLDLTGL
ncbi:ulp1 protease family protein [Sporothrix brasiliensis 5110]|uniref:Ulp1 protease family protein n=1 Tax=Sporothrix brasiliensis 5110 TaxID=1398154 RepID=A0A0C2FVD2_9PEZI|nr:ulp1 protease family protein [Sporothrix brasiliensis 5110]KIH95003.1 ulp1 protease family protein [Sporothrix brasiliensis 5110]